MTDVETKKILTVMQAGYSQFYKDMPVENKVMLVKLWESIFKDYTYQQVAQALQVYMMQDKKGFPPVPGQLIEKMSIVEHHTELNEMEAWALVSNALRDSAYHAEEQFSKLPPLVQKSVGTASQLRNWGQTDIQSVENVVQSNFCRTYREMLRREHEYQAVPQSVRQAIDHTTTMMIWSENNERI